MSATLLVPVRLDALLLATDEAVVEEAADFSRLPYCDGTRDVNADTAYLSEEILSHPFDNRDLFLKPGVHLHWALPDTLTHATGSAGLADFPAVPNRWLVMRSRGGSVEWTRVVESDFLWPEGQGGADAGAVTVPVDPDPARGRYRPYRHLGRGVPLALWQPTPAPDAEYLPRLTAVGYGEPGFASVYPNCRSVFGTHDPLPAADAAGARYDVLGWYADPADDRLNAFLRELPAPEGGQRTPEGLRAAVEAGLKWRAPDEEPAEFPDRILCYARLEFAADARPVEAPEPAGAVEGIALATTGVEALSAFLAGRVAGAAGSKAAVETQLESLQLLPRLQHRGVDVGANLREGRHELGFVARPGGTQWALAAEDRAGPAPADAARARREAVLPAGVLDRLDEVNRLQEDYDAACDRVEALRAQAFADWYRAMVCAYPPPGGLEDLPDPDEARHFVETRSLRRLTRALEDAGTLSLGRNPSGALAAARGSEAGSRAALLADALTGLLAEVAALNQGDDLAAAGAEYVLRDAPGPRFWEAREPVVLVVGPYARPSDRHGADGVLACDVLAGTTPAGVVAAGVDALLRTLDAVHARRGPTGPGFRPWTAQPWNPLVLEWQAELLPLLPGGNLDPDDPNYAPDHVTASFTLPVDEPDLAVRGRAAGLRKGVDVYTGSTPLTRSAAQLLARRLEEYLATPDAADGAGAAGPLRAALAELAGPGFHALSQSLGGFNQALLMRRQTRQLPVADPLGYLADADFAARVSRAVAGRTRSAPQPLLDFNPLRTGALRLLRLRLVDSFGRVRDLDCSGVVTTELLRTPGDPGLVWLPPRLVPPARLDFRWLPAAGAAGGAGGTAERTPVCGWLLPNNLDGSLQVYDAGGAALGLIDLGGTWRAPAAGMLADPAAIADPALRRTVAWLLEKCAEDDEDSAFLAAFLAAVNGALESIDPEGTAQQAGLALLMGRPVALARATLGVEVQGPLPVHQGWNQFRRDMGRTTRDTDRVERVRFPLRVGEHGQLNDGVVGYWVETAGGAYDGRFIAPQSDPAGHPAVVTAQADPAPISRALSDPPLTLAILLDPRGVVHATSGIVPAQELSIPPEQYAAALAAIQVLFLTTSLLTDAGELNLPLPAAPGFRWEWQGSEPLPIGSVSPAATFAPQEVREGWLRLVPDP